MFGGSGEEKEEKRGRGQSLISLSLSLSDAYGFLSRVSPRDLPRRPGQVSAQKSVRSRNQPSYVSLAGGHCKNRDTGLGHRSALEATKSFLSCERDGCDNCPMRKRFKLAIDI